MAAPGTWEFLRFCFLGDGRRSLSGRLAIVCAWCFTLAVLVFNAFFGLLFEDGNLVIRGGGTLILGAPLLWPYARGKRAMRDRASA